MKRFLRKQRPRHFLITVFWSGVKLNGQVTYSTTILGGLVNYPNKETINKRVKEIVLSATNQQEAIESCVVVNIIEQSKAECSVFNSKIGV